MGTEVEVGDYSDLQAGGFLAGTGIAVFLPEGGDCFNASLLSVTGNVSLNSSIKKAIILSYAIRSDLYPFFERDPGLFLH
jgi:hypothetical protein